MCYCFSVVSLRYSVYLFLVSVVFFVYHVIDALLFWWSFKEEHLFYWDLLTTAAVMIKQSVKPMKEKTLARIKFIFN